MAIVSVAAAVIAGGQAAKDCNNAVQEFKQFRAGGNRPGINPNDRAGWMN
jgi:hypothetical protein